ncbi:hypothetical protein ACFX2K_028156 [Malus domestica]
MPGTPQQNGVAERRNRTLMDMVKSMISNSSLPLSMWSEALKTPVYVLIRVPSKAVPKTPFEIWNGGKPSLRHLHVWGCPVKVRVYNPQLKKLDSRTISGFFIGYPPNSKGFKFFCPSHTPRIVEARNAKFLEDHELSGSEFPRNIEIEKINEANESSSKEGRLVVFQENHSIDIPEKQPVQVEPLHEEQAHEELTPQNEQIEDHGVVIRKSTRIKKPAISSDYVVFLQESDYDVGPLNDPCLFSQAMNGPNSNLWYNAMQEEMKSMAKNQVWEVVELPNGHSTIGCKWV